jgi:hypothetical protein
VVLPITRLIWRSIGEGAATLQLTIKPVTHGRRKEQG